jgi:nucleoside-diphosphate-sugar epimerase
MKQPGQWHIWGVSRNANDRHWQQDSGPLGQHLYVENRLDLNCHADVAEADEAVRARTWCSTWPATPWSSRTRSAFQTNVDSTHYLLEHCEPDTRFVFASSAAVYGDPRSTGRVRRGLPV